MTKILEFRKVDPEILTLPCLGNIIFAVIFALVRSGGLIYLSTINVKHFQGTAYRKTLISLQL